MPFNSFMFYNIVGGIFWIGSLMILGFTLGSQVENADKYIEPIILVIVVVSFIPVYREWRRNKKK